MITLADADIASTIPKIIVSMKYKSNQMSSQNSPKMTMNKMVEMRPQKQFPEQIPYSSKKTRTIVPSKNSKNDKTPTVTIEMHNNLKYVLNK